MTFLRVEKLTKQWDASSNPTVDGISFSLAKNQFTALLGPSGCGKSTILNMIAGLELPTSGAVYIDDQDVTQSPPGKRQLSMVFQSYALFPHLSVTSNILFGLQARKVSRQEQQQRLENALSLVNLGAQRDKKPGQLSGGQRQRVALARAIVAQAPLCLMDEPLSNLDAKLRQEMRTEIRALQKQLGLSVLYVTHDQVEAMSMADEIILLNQGSISQQAKPADLYARPSNTFAATFVGTPPMNILQTEDAQYRLGIRPEHIRLVDDHNDNTGFLDNVDEVYPVSVVSIDYHGAETLINAQLGDQTLNISVPGHHEYPAQTQLRIRLPSAQRHYFACDTEQVAPDISDIPPLLAPTSTAF